MLERQIQELKLEGRVHLVGHLPDPHLALAGANVFVLSSTAEGLGSSILAAMALDLPVVASRVGGVVDLLGSGAGVMVSPGSPAEFAAGVRRVLTEPELRENLTRAAREKLGDYSVNTVAARVLGVYRSCVHSLDGS
jgi:glycosyltransferase involved in cell wall biosynthesis